MFCDNSEVPNKPAFYRNLTQDLGPGMDKLQLTGRFIRLWTMMYHRHMVLLWLEKTGGKANMQCVMACDEQPASKMVGKKNISEMDMKHHQSKKRRIIRTLTARYVETLKLLQMPPAKIHPANFKTAKRF